MLQLPLTVDAVSLARLGTVTLLTALPTQLVLPCLPFYMLVLIVCIGFAWQGFGSRGATGVASVRSC